MVLSELDTVYNPDAFGSVGFFVFGCHTTSTRYSRKYVTFKT